MHTHILIHYGELALKGQNRSYFENSLVLNIKSKTNLPVERQWGRLIIKTNEKPDLGNIPGISNYMYAVKSELNIDDILAKVSSLASEAKFKSFKIKTTRSNKKFQYNSQETNTIIGSKIVDITNSQVNLDSPEKTFYIEIANDAAYISSHKMKGIGGLPAGVTGKVISLLSGGIDSPVASFYMMKRGCSVIYVHFHHHGKTGSKNKVKKLVEVLSEFHRSKLYLIPFREIQDQIIKVIPSKYRMIIYRRIMVKISELILRKEKALGLVTGDSLAQVASQTLENLNVIHSAAAYPILSPLIGMDKTEITAKAREIGTYEISIQPHEDCCSYLIDKHPETKGKIQDILRLEQSLVLDLHKVVDESQVLKFPK